MLFKQAHKDQPYSAVGSLERSCSPVFAKQEYGRKPARNQIPIRSSHILQIASGQKSKITPQIKR